MPRAKEKAPVNSDTSLAAEFGNRGGIQWLPERIDRYSVAHERALLMRDYLEDAHGLEDEYRKLSSCGEYLLFKWFYTLDSVKLAAMHSCKLHLLCPLCAIRRGAKLLDAYLGKFAHLSVQYPNLTPVFFTLTVKDGGDLVERYKHLTKSYRTLRQRARDALRGKGAFNEMNSVAGAVWSYEAKRGSGSGLWHPHLHAFALCTQELDQRALSEQWKEITGDSFIVETHPVYGEPIEAFLEVFKYAIKFSDMPLFDNVTAYEALKARRLVDSCGIFRGVDVPEGLEDDLTGLDDLPYSEMLFRFVEKQGYLLERNYHRREAA